MFRVIRDVDLWFLIEDSKKKKMILFSDRKYSEKISSVLKNLDVDIAYKIFDDPINDEQSVYDLLMENPDDIMVVVAKDDFSKAKATLNSLGLKIGVSYKNLRKYTFESLSAPYYYDPVCGYNLFTDDKYNGFRMFGNPESDAVRILTIGGSTTDAYLYPFKCWSEYLHEMINESGIENVVMCGAVSGYSSADELYKIIRDGVELKPDIIINYSGCNDIKLGDYPYINSYMKRISNYLSGQNSSIGTRFESNPFGVTWGIKGEREPDSNYRFWIRNQRMINAICSEMGIKHITVHQPNMCNGKVNMSTYEEEYLGNICFCGVDKQSVEKNKEQSIRFRQLVCEDAKKLDWLEDMSGIFDNEDVYIDRLHINEEGNRIVASNIFEVLKQHQFI
ncbi:MAG: SGNH/GDSL hydrolase family protein [Lachnospiraceae bacterium]|nr:SGNH/GDSL hydrolase family protein [Lachnospiraceae bacterium]